jgi:hypothetical protein
MGERDTDSWGTTHRPSLEELQREFPDWTITKAVSGLWYASRPQASGAEPSGLIRGEDSEDLRDMIRGWIGRHDGRDDR